LTTSRSMMVRLLPPRLTGESAWGYDCSLGVRKIAGMDHYEITSDSMDLRCSRMDTNAQAYTFTTLSNLYDIDSATASVNYRWGGNTEQ